MAFQLIGVIHLPALPGAPRASLSLQNLTDWALRDAETLAEGGIAAAIIENFGDAPFSGGSVDPHVPALMAVVADRIARAFPSLSLGINVLRNDAAAALGIARACGADFIRVNVHTGAAWTDQGLIEGRAHETLRYRAAIGAEGVRIAADVDVKHAVPAGEVPLAVQAEEAHQRGLADVLIVTGKATGAPTDREDLRAVRAAVSCPVWVGSGVTADTVADLPSLADGAVVGTALHRNGDIAEPLDSARVAGLVARLSG